MNSKQKREAAKVAKASVGLKPSDPVGPADQSLAAHRGVELATDAPKSAAELGVGKDGKAVKPPKVSKTGLPALPRLPRTRKPKTPKDCECGCGGQTKGGRFVPGHDARLHGWAVRVERKVCELKDVEPAGTREAVRKLLLVKA